MVPPTEPYSYFTGELMRMSTFNCASLTRTLVARKRRRDPGFPQAAGVQGSKLDPWHFSKQIWFFKDHAFHATFNEGAYGLNSAILIWTPEASEQGKP